MSDVVMPQLSDSMEEGTILTWLVDDGGAVAAGQELAEIETDKATMTYAAEAAGTLEVVAAAGSTVAVGEVIARVGSGARAPVAAEAPVAPETSAGSETPAGPEAPHSDAREVAATPMARRIATVHGVELRAVTGSGPRGRVLRADVLDAAGLAAETPAPAAASAPPAAAAGRPAPAPGAGDADTRVELTRLQTRVARRMAEAKATVPHFQVQTEVEMTAALTFREQLRSAAAARELPTPSLNDLVVKASALCLRRFPIANGSYVDGGFVLHGHVNVGVAVAADDALVVPVVHDADALTLGEIAERTRRLAGAVREGTVSPPELSGATFTVSNLGMYGMTAITPVVNPPQAAILGVGAIREALGRDAEGEIVDRRRLTLTLSCDHRILYGADAARFLAAIRELLEAPAGLAL